LQQRISFVTFLWAVYPSKLRRLRSQQEQTLEPPDQNWKGIHGDLYSSLHLCIAPGALFQETYRAIMTTFKPVNWIPRPLFVHQAADNTLSALHSSFENSESSQKEFGNNSERHFQPCL
jgi:hypothetical protein